MEETTSELTIKYIKEHPDIKSCLKKGLINYSSLARQIAKELDIEKKTSIEAILISARRFKEKLGKDSIDDKKIIDLLSKSELEIKNKIVVFILEKTASMDEISLIQAVARKEFATFFFLEGSDSCTIIAQEKLSSRIEKSFKGLIIRKSQNLALINFKSPKEIETIPGVSAFLCSLLAENNVNILEQMSIWSDSIFVIESKDINKSSQLLTF